MSGIASAQQALKQAMAAIAGDGENKATYEKIKEALKAAESVRPAKRIDHDAVWNMANNAMLTMGERITARREALGWRVADLAYVCQTNVLNVQKWESGEIRPRYQYLAILCAALDVSTDYLLGFSGKKADLKVISGGGR